MWALPHDPPDTSGQESASCLTLYRLDDTKLLIISEMTSYANTSLQDKIKTYRGG